MHICSATSLELKKFKLLTGLRRADAEVYPTRVEDLRRATFRSADLDKKSTPLLVQ